MRRRREMATAGIVTAMLAALVAVMVWAAAPSLAQAAPAVADAWGFNKDGELGNGTTEGSYVPVEVSRLNGVAAVAGGGHHSLALMQDGSVMAWGANGQGQLGNGTIQSSDLPVPVSGLREVAAIAAGGDHSLARLKNGTVMAWGRNTSGQLGDGTTASSDVPAPVKGLSGVAAISAGAGFSLALLQNGTVMAWGDNFHGQLGDGSTGNRDVPVAVRGLGAVTAISAGSWHSLALLSDGTMIAWGSNEDGQLGDGTETSSDGPVSVKNLTGVTAVSAGHRHSLAVIAGGALVAWGDNVEGQLGVGSRFGPELCGTPPIFACSRIPVAVKGIDEVTAVSAGIHSLALLSDHTVMGWGSNNAGQLGDGVPGGPELCAAGEPCSAQPVAVCATGPQFPCPTGPALTGVKAIAAGEAHSLASVEPPLPLPEIGRCVRVVSGGAYAGTGPRCIVPSATHEGHFEWLPGPGPRAKFTDALDAPTFETVGGTKLDCATGVVEGEYTGPKTEKIGRLLLRECFDVKTSTSCQSDPLQTGVVENSVPLKGELGFIKSGERPTVGWELQAETPAAPLASFECGSVTGPIARTLEGRVIARTTPIDRMLSSSELLFNQARGKQIPESFEAGTRSVLTLSSASPTTPMASGQVRLSSKVVRVDEEPQEIKAKL